MKTIVINGMTNVTFADIYCTRNTFELSIQFYLFSFFGFLERRFVFSARRRVVGENRSARETRLFIQMEYLARSVTSKWIGSLKTIVVAR